MIYLILYEDRTYQLFNDKQYQGEFPGIRFKQYEVYPDVTVFELYHWARDGFPTSGTINRVS